MIRDEKGQSMTEFALIVPLLLLLLCAVFDMGRVMYAYIHLNMAAQETVRLGGLGRSDADIAAFANSYVHLGSASNLQVIVDPADSVRKPGDYVTVKLVYTLSYMTPLIGQILPAPVIEADSSIRVE